MARAQQAPTQSLSQGQPTEEVFVISVAAELSGMHAQTLRTYDRLGLVTPARTSGGGRRYSRADVAMLRRIQKLSQEDGVNLAGIKAIIELTRENEDLKGEVAQLRAENEHIRQHSSSRGGELVHVPRSTAVVMWTPNARRGRR
ncbi:MULTISPECIES: heat shock protein transcriptional repressor HspR [unclassified Corynebacterium]|uniref:heat shock protein transcriptional repressor HspR n=1 Tax=unclassified Corynebacterium TaxID=2624378 RepID=UPI0029CA0E1E|nr:MULTISPECIES: helix-turn-helix transcriptional regulator [unclassified Corynebacterium]WPF65949.1 helix-turn-helix transcriptional regulator [Corynebacterium sp. 22KM0430]WPF68442.1 helix-turn-helix transcriptional regulator [Corynebacterium sp. 21KM1197]